MKKALTLLLCMAMLASLFTVASFADEEKDFSAYTPIGTEEELINMEDDGVYLLTADITLTKDWVTMDYFEGVLNGNGHKIINYKSSGPMIDTLDMFGIVKNITFVNAEVVNATATKEVAIFANDIQGKVYNVNIDGGKVSTKEKAAGVIYKLSATGEMINCEFKNMEVTSTGIDASGVSYDNYGKMSYLTFDGTVKGNGDRASGIVGYVRAGATVDHCVSKGLVESNFHVAGITSQLNGGTVSNCLNFATIVAHQSRASGIACSDRGAFVITNCGNYGLITSWRTAATATNADAKVGGMISSSEDANENARITNCFNAGNLVTNYLSGQIGGMIAYFKSTDKLTTEIFTNCYTLENTLWKYQQEHNGEYTDTSVWLEHSNNKKNEKSTVEVAGNMVDQYSGTFVTATEFASEAMITKLGSGFKLSGDATYPIALADSEIPAEPVSEDEIAKPAESDEPATSATAPETSAAPAASAAPATTTTAAPSGTEAPATEAPVTDGSSGCKSVIGGGVAVIVAILGGAVLAVRRKEEE